jgi:hypothetical protein
MKAGTIARTKAGAIGAKVEATPVLFCAHVTIE